MIFDGFDFIVVGFLRIGFTRAKREMVKSGLGEHTTGRIAKFRNRGQGERISLAENQLNSAEFFGECNFPRRLRALLRLQIKLRLRTRRFAGVARRRNAYRDFFHDRQSFT
ncbi:hypothetical protein DWB58_27920 [candidate division KSB1 bacterium]|nr:hypothetical protein [candidate division KSB1 bacterium]